MYSETTPLLPVYDFAFRKIVISNAGMGYTFFTKQFLLFLVLVISLLALLDTFDFCLVMPIWMSVLFWTVFVIAQIWLDALLLFLAIRLRQKFAKRLILFFPVVGALAMLANTFATNSMFTVLAGTSFRVSEGFNNLGINLFIGFFIESFYFSFVRQSIQVEFVEKASAPTGDVCIGKQVFQLSDIILLRSSDHYVEVTTHDSKIMVRSRLGDVIDQIPVENGIMPHRSYWVAKHEIAPGSFFDDSTKVLLKNGSDIPIAAGRKGEVRAWFSKFGPSKLG